MRRSAISLLLENLFLSKILGIFFLAIEVRAAFELVAAGLVDVRGAKDVEALNAGGKRNGATNHGAGALGGVNNFKSRLIDQLVVIRLEADANALRLHFVFL